MRAAVLVLVLVAVAASACSDSDSSGSGTPGECKTKLRVRADDAEDDEKGTAFDTRRVVAEVAGDGNGATIELAVFGGYEPDTPGVPDDPTVPDDGRLVLVSMEAPDGLTKGETFTEQVGDGEPTITSATFWDGPDEVDGATVSVTVTDFTDNLVCGSLEVEGDPSVTGTFQAKRR